MTLSVPPKNSSGEENMKTGPGALGTAENESGSAKHTNGTRRPRYRRKVVQDRKTWKQDPAPSVSPRTSPGAQYMKTDPDALGTAPNKCRSAKHENGTRRSRYRPKWVRECNTWKQALTPLVPLKMSLGAQSIKTGLDALDIAQNESGNVKNEYGTRRPWYRRKWSLGVQNMQMGPHVLGIVENESRSAKHKKLLHQIIFSKVIWSCARSKQHERKLENWMLRGKDHFELCDITTMDRIN
jgi:hypothetical protein